MATPAALVVEDGTAKATANTFITEAELIAFCDDRGLTYAPNDHDRVHNIIQAADYLISVENKFQGERTSTTQAMPFPRDGVRVHGNYIGANAIPVTLKHAQCYLAQLAYKNDLQPTGDGKEVIEERVGPLGTKYNPAGDGGARFVPTPALAFLRPLFKWDAAHGIPIMR